jgi:hypothetical protein
MADKRATVTEPAYMRNMGVLNATRIGGTRKPRERAKGAYAGELGMMRVTRPDGTDVIVPAGSYGRKATARARGKRTAALVANQAARDKAAMARMGTIHEEGA